ncbi:MAG TPA: DUF4783 domain-containing protein [Mucilaginibacter sp.]|jgi:hypothetical protein|nr:DUF4783 domain-containing protein [Mucilaginibacter sp.]
MKLLYLPLLFVLCVAAASTADPIDKVADLIRQGNAPELSKMFASNVEMTILGEENVYSKDQSEVILEKFFNQNKPLAVKIIHKVNSNPNYLFGVLNLTTDKGTFRVSYTLKDTNGSQQLIELRIETEKVK